MAIKNSDSASLADADLVLRTRSGDTDAFGELWRRHYPSGVSVARSVTSSIDPDDLVQESYARIYQAILKGGGPNGSFRAYLCTSIRNTAAAWGRARRETPIDELDTVADPSSTDAAENEALDRGLTAQAFRSLPSRWQEVLWYSEIEQMKPADIAPLLGMSAGAVSQLAFRAREGLREAWVQVHLRTAGKGSECRWTIENLGAHARGNLGARAQQRIDNHLDSCARCMIVAAEAQDVSSRLALVLLPLVLGVSGASGYLASLQGGGTPLVALAAMPSSVVEGAVVASGTGGAALGVSTSGSTGASSSASASSGSISGIGALVGAGSAALIVAGVVAAAAVVPAMLAATTATSQPNASEADSSSIASEVAPDESMNMDETVVVEVDDHSHESPMPRPTPEPTPPPGAAPTPRADTAPATPAEAAPEPVDSRPAPDPEPTPEPSPEPSAIAPATITPSPAPSPTPTPTPEPSPEPTPQPTPDPSLELTQEPTSEPTPTPVSITWGAADVEFAGGLAHYLIPVTGTPDATVQVWMNRNSARGDEAVLDRNGNGTAQLRANPKDLLDDVVVGFRYKPGGGIVDSTWIETSLLELGNPLLPSP